MPTNPIVRDGFSYAFGRFVVTPHDEERVLGSDLRDAFLPELTAKGEAYLRRSDNGGFVRSQLKHYGVTFDESELIGDGTLLLKEALEAGKCDEVPRYITKRRAEMQNEWLEQLTEKELEKYPKLAMDMYFLTSGQPDHAKTTTVIGLPVKQDSYCGSSWDICRAVDKITGLHHAKGNGYKAETVFVGWDRTAVIEAAKRYQVDEKKVAEDAKKERDAERSRLHNDYLETLKQKKGPKAFSPVGTYMVDCDEIEEQWPDDAEDLHLNIRATKQAGIFTAPFHFGILEGIMVIGPDKPTVKKYCNELDRKAGKAHYDSEDDSDSDSEEDDDDNEEEKDEGKAGSNKKRSAPKTKSQDQGHPPKRAKPSTPQPHQYYMQLRCAETQEHQVYSVPNSGTITFDGDNLASFTAEASIPCVGSAIPFRARKTSNKVSGRAKSWAKYADDSYGTETAWVTVGPGENPWDYI